MNFPGAYHKHFWTLTQAESFISDWTEMFACLAKANIKRELLDGRRSEIMQEWFLQFQLKKDTDEVEHNLTYRRPGEDQIEEFPLNLTYSKPPYSLLGVCVNVKGDAPYSLQECGRRN